MEEEGKDFFREADPIDDLLLMERRRVRGRLRRVISYAESTSNKLMKPIRRLIATGGSGISPAGFSTYRKETLTGC